MVPTPIYEALPGLYIAGGTWACIAGENPAAGAFGAMLAALGGIIAGMRYLYRRG